MRRPAESTILMKGTPSFLACSITLTSYVADSANAGQYFSNAITISGVNAPNFKRSSSVSGFEPNRRIVVTAE